MFSVPHADSSRRRDANGAGKKANLVNKLFNGINLPMEWYDLEETGAVTVHKPSNLKIAYVLINIIGALAFAGQCFYHYVATVPETTVSAQDKSGTDGWTCRPLVGDKIYGLNMTYDECMTKEYVPPTVDNLIRYGHYGLLVYSGFDGSQPPSSYDGPWNFTTGLRYSINTMTLYHKPFPHLSDVVYSYPDTCVVPFYKGYEKHSKFNPQDGYMSPTEMPFSEAYKRGYDYFNGYGYIGLANKELKWDSSCTLDTPWNCGQYGTFHPSNETDYVAKCDGAISAAEQADLFENGTYSFPHVFAAPSELRWAAPASAQPYTEKGKGDYFVIYKQKCVGITPLYPKTTTLKLVTDKSRPRGDDDFFGKQRCNFYEKQIGVESFEYLFSQPNCHPCQIFKENAPFFCKREVRKTWVTIFALSISNTLFFMGILITWAPVVLRGLFSKEQQTE